MIEDWTPEKIKSALMEASVTQSGIARDLKVSPVSIHQVIQKRMTSHRIRQAIAQAIGKDRKVIWPSVYLYGVPRKRGRPAGQGIHHKKVA